MRTLREQLDVMMANEEQSLKSSQKFFDEVGQEVAKGRIKLLEEIKAQYDLEGEKFEALQQEAFKLLCELNICRTALHGKGFVESYKGEK